MALTPEDNALEMLVRFTPAGIEIPSFTDVHKSLIDKYKAVYGSDINLTTGTADGNYIYNQSLELYNMFRAIQYCYDNLDIDTAGGIWLDRLCALTNVYRREATQSSANLTVTNRSGFGLNTASITFEDNSGNTWKTPDLAPVALTDNVPVSVTVFCTKPGPVLAPAGSINKIIELADIEVVQEQPAIPGRYAETDAELKSRRLQSSGASGISVLGSIEAALRSLTGIEDVKIINNNTGAEVTAYDSTVIPGHSVYVIIRYSSSTTVPDATIGRIIHDKLTPGIPTTKPTALAAQKTYKYIESTFGLTTPEISQNVYWKKAIGIKPEITITANAEPFFVVETANAIGEAVKQAVNGLPLATSSVTFFDTIRRAALGADPKFAAQSTFTIPASGIVCAGLADAYIEDYTEYTTVTVTNVGTAYTIKIA